MKIYINTILNTHWNGEEEWLKLYTTFPMSKHEFVEYFNKHIAGKDIETYRNLGISTNIWWIKGVDEYSSTREFPKIELDEDENEDEWYCDIYFADKNDPDYYYFYSECVSLVDI